MKSMALNQQGMHALIRSGIVKSILTAVVVMQLVACGGGSTGGNDASASGGGILSASGTTSGTNTSTSSSSGQSATSTTGSLSLSWVHPVARADGTPLSLADIDGFHIYYGNSPGNYPYRVKVNDATKQRATLTNLPRGTYYIVMTTYDIDGRESSHSVMVKKTVS